MSATKNWKPEERQKQNNSDNKYIIENTVEVDLSFIYKMFEDAIEFHKENNYPVWKGYDKPTLKREVKEKLEYKIVIENQIAFIFSVNYSDKFIWRELDNGDAIYIHRVVVNPAFRGQKLFTIAFEFLKEHARSKNIPYIRLDTWADNPKMIAYYQSFGFRFVETYRTPDTEDLPIPHRNAFCILLEYKV